MVEKFWLAAGPVAFTAIGTDRGIVQVTSTAGFKVKMLVRISHPSQPPLSLEVKRVNSEFEMELGPSPGKITDRTDLSSYPIGTTAYAAQQKRNDVPLQEINRAVYEEEPAVAIRTVEVDQWGDFYDTENPLPVKLAVGNVEASLDVQLSHQDNYPNPGDIHDSVRIGNGTNELTVNEDGSINVRLIGVTGEQVNGTVVSYFDEVSGVSAGVETTIISLAVGLGETLHLAKIDAGGENIGLFNVYVNGSLVAKKRTYFQGGYDVVFDFQSEPDRGIKLSAGDVIEVKVTHNRPGSASFEAQVVALRVTDLTPHATSLFNSVNSIPYNTEMQILGYTVPVGSIFSINHVEVGGENIAVYLLYINGILRAKVRTSFGSGLTEFFDFDSEPDGGLQVAPGGVISIRVINARPSACSFEARLVGKETPTI